MKPTLIPELRAKVLPLVGLLALHVAERILRENGEADEHSVADAVRPDEKVARGGDED